MLAGSALRDVFGAGPRLSLGVRKGGLGKGREDWKGLNLGRHTERGGLSPLLARRTLLRGLGKERGRGREKRGVGGRGTWRNAS